MTLPIVFGANVDPVWQPVGLDYCIWPGRPGRAGIIPE
jgi:hypothetical protein